MSPYITPPPIYRESSKASAQGATALSTTFYKDDLAIGARVSCGTHTTTKAGTGISICGVTCSTTVGYAEAYVNGALKQSVQCAGNPLNCHAIALGYQDYLPIGKVLEGKCYNSGGAIINVFDKFFSGVLIG